jgi:protein CpxP
MNRIRINWLTIAVAALVLLNIGLMATIWLQRKAPAKELAGPKGPDPLASELGFDSMQRLRFDTLREQHRAIVRGYREQMRSLKEQFFDGIKRQDPPSDTLATSIARLQASIDKATYVHFAQVRALCREDQKPEFDRLLHRILAQMGAPRPRREAPDGPRSDGPPGGHDGGPDGGPDGPDGPPPGEHPPGK